jgi:hypothetical protein
MSLHAELSALATPVTRRKSRLAGPPMPGAAMQTQDESLQLSIHEVAGFSSERRVTERYSPVNDEPSIHMSDVSQPSVFRDAAASDLPPLSPAPLGARNVNVSGKQQQQQEFRPTMVDDLSSDDDDSGIGGDRFVVHQTPVAVRAPPQAASPYANTPVRDSSNMVEIQAENMRLAQQLATEIAGRQALQAALAAAEERQAAMARHRDDREVECRELGDFVGRLEAELETERLRTASMAAAHSVQLEAVLAAKRGTDERLAVAARSSAERDATVAERGEHAGARSGALMQQVVALKVQQAEYQSVLDRLGVALRPPFTDAMLGGAKLRHSLLTAVDEPFPEPQVAQRIRPHHMTGAAPSRSASVSRERGGSSEPPTFSAVADDLAEPEQPAQQHFAAAPRFTNSVAAVETSVVLPQPAPRARPQAPAFPGQSRLRGDYDCRDDQPQMRRHSAAQRLSN